MTCIFLWNNYNNKKVNTHCTEKIEDWRIKAIEPHVADNRFYYQRLTVMETGFDETSKAIIAGHIKQISFASLILLSKIRSPRGLTIEGWRIQDATFASQTGADIPLQYAGTPTRRLNYAIYELIKLSDILQYNTTAQGEVCPFRH